MTSKNLVDIVHVWIGNRVSLQRKLLTCHYLIWSQQHLQQCKLQLNKPKSSLLVMARHVSIIHVSSKCIKLLWLFVELSWSFQRIFDLCLEGMHFLMSYIGSIRSLMSRSGLKGILEKDFRGVAKMITGKKFPQYVWALRMLVDEILHPRNSRFPQQVVSCSWGKK